MPKEPNLLKDIQKLELDPNKSYIFFLPYSPAPYETRQRLIESLHAQLKERGIDNLVVMCTDPPNIRIIETPPHAKD